MENILLAITDIFFKYASCTYTWEPFIDLLTWINFSPNMDKLLQQVLSVGWNYLSIPKLVRCQCWCLEMDDIFIQYVT